MLAARQRAPHNLRMDPFAGRPLATLEHADLEGLVERCVSENVHLDYKLDLGELLSPNNDRARNARQECLADLTAFANAFGGLVLWGVEEDRDSNDNPAGTPKAIPGIKIENPDQLRLRIEGFLQDGVDERLPGLVEIECVALENDRYVLAIRVPASLRAPHMVVLGGMRQFFMRTNSGKQPMSAGQIRDAALRTESLVDRTRRLLADRLTLLRAKADGKPFWTVHVIPLLREPYRIDVTRPEVIQRLRAFYPLGSAGGNPRHCLEGFRCEHNDAKYGDTYCLIAREGWIEWYDEACVKPRSEDRRYWPYAEAENCLFKAIEQALSLYRDGLLAAPALVSLALVNLHNHVLPARLSWDSVVLPDGSVVPGPALATDIAVDVKTVCKPLLDVIWNAAGHPRCPGYDQNGVYVGYPQ